MTTFNIPLLGFIAFSGTGKTTLLEKLIPRLNAHHIRVGLIKHAHHELDIDIPGKDSYRLRKAGASEVIVASTQRWALMHENDTTQPEPTLTTLLQKMTLSSLDLILVEGFKQEAIPCIELHRTALNKPLLYTNNTNVIAIASDQPNKSITNFPHLDINHLDEITGFVLHFYQSHRSTS